MVLRKNTRDGKDALNPMSLKERLGGLVSRLGELRYVLELGVVTVVLWLLVRFGVLSFQLGAFIVSVAFFAWSARYGLIVYVLSLVVFQVLALITEGSIKVDLSVRSFSVLFITSGLPVAVIGEILNRRLRNAQNELRKQSLALERMKHELARSTAVIEQLQMNVYFEGEGLIVLLERLRELEILDSEEIITRAVEIFAEFFSLEDLHFYRVEGSFLRYVAGVGTKKMPNTLRIGDSAVVRKAVETGQAFLADVIFEGYELGDVEPFFAVSVGSPVVSSQNDVVGVFVVEDIPYQRFSQNLVRYIRSVGSWLHANIKVVMEQEKVLEREFKKGDGTWHEEYYENRKRVMEKRRERFGIPFEELCVSYDGRLHERIVREFRKSDVLTARWVGERVYLRVLLAVCDESGKKKVLERLTSRYEIEVCEGTEHVGARRNLGDGYVPSDGQHD